MTIFDLKIIACITMLLDHIRYLIPGLQTSNCLYILGRISFPIFAFVIVQGYIHTSNLKKYVKRLIIFALISQIPFMLFRTLVGDWKMLNILFTFLLGIGCIYSYDKIKNPIISTLILSLLLLSTLVINVDYGLYGVLTVFIIYVFRNSKFKSLLAISLNIILFLYMENALMINLKIVELVITTLVTYIVIFYSYNEKLGKRMKYFFYCFYPTHLMIIYLMSVFLIK